MWDLLSFIQGKDRKLALKELAEGPKTPSQMAENSDKHLSHISRALRELEDKNLVECKNPQANKNRFYEITEKGEELLKKSKKIED